MNVFSTLGTTVPTGGNFICLTGIVTPAEEIGIIQRGNFRLVGLGGNVIATLTSAGPNLAFLTGRLVTVCGLNEGVIEGVRSVRVTQVLSAQVSPVPFGQNLDLRTLLLLSLLSGAGRINPNLLLLLFLSGQFGGFGGGFGKFGKASPFSKFGKTNPFLTAGAGLGTGLGAFGGLGTTAVTPGATTTGV